MVDFYGDYGWFWEYEDGWLEFYFDCVDVEEGEGGSI